MMSHSFSQPLNNDALIRNGPKKMTDIRATNTSLEFELERGTSVMGYFDYRTFFIQNNNTRSDWANRAANCNDDLLIQLCKPNERVLGKLHFSDEFHNTIHVIRFVCVRCTFCWQEVWSSFEKHWVKICNWLAILIIITHQTVGPSTQRTISYIWRTIKLSIEPNSFFFRSKSVPITV